MNSAEDPWLCLLLIALLGGLFFLRVRFPNASKRSETVVLIAATVLFFSICNFFLGPNGSIAQKSEPSHSPAAAASVR